MDVSKNSGIPKSSILVGFSIINHPFWGIYPYFGKHPNKPQAPHPSGWIYWRQYPRDICGSHTHHTPWYCVDLKRLIHIISPENKREEQVSERTLRIKQTQSLLLYNNIAKQWMYEGHGRNQQPLCIKLSIGTIQYYDKCPPWFCWKPNFLQDVQEANRPWKQANESQQRKQGTANYYHLNKGRPQ